MKHLIAFTICVLLIKNLYSQPGSLDSSFGVNGIVRGNSDFYNINDIDLQANGKIILMLGTQGGYYRYSIVRLNTNGTFDKTFGNKGIVDPFEKYGYREGFSVVVQPDQKIVAGGYVEAFCCQEGRDFALARYKANGVLDSSFGNNGIVVTLLGPYKEAVCYSLALQPDGKILAGGEIFNSFTVIRYNKNGSIDSAFGYNGITQFKGFQGNPQKLLLQNDGKILLSGTTIPDIGKPRFVVVRFTKNGIVDSTFGLNGASRPILRTERSDYCQGMALQADEKIILAGCNSVNNVLITKGDLNGRYFDTSFADSGVFNLRQPERFCGSIALQKDEKILIGGAATSQTFLLMRFLNDGTIDSSFANNGTQITPINQQIGSNGRAIKVQPDGKILLGGGVLARYNGDDKTNSNNIISNTELKAKNFTSIKVFPNPASTSINIVTSKPATLSLIDANGQKLLNKTINLSGNINVSHLPAGVYYLEDTKTKAIVKWIKE